MRLFLFNYLPARNNEKGGKHRAPFQDMFLESVYNIQHQLLLGPVHQWYEDPLGIALFKTFYYRC